MSTQQFKRTLVTTALPYANGPVHIGHLAGVYVPADIYVRYKRMKGDEVLFIGGSDEHGVPIAIKAKAEGVSPQEIVDRYHTLIKESFARLGIDFDIYSRTTSETHEKTASAFFTKLYESGKLIAVSYTHLRGVPPSSLCQDSRALVRPPSQASSPTCSRSRSSASLS